MTSLSDKFLVFQPLGLQRIRSEPPLLVLLIVLEVAFEPFHMGFAFEGQNMRADSIQEKPVVADDHGAAGEIDERVFQSP